MDTKFSFFKINLFVVFLLFVNIYASFSTVLPIFADIVIIAFLFLYNKKLIALNKFQLNLLVMSLLVLFMLLLSAVTNGVFSSYSIFRGVRVSLLILFMSLICNNYLKKISFNVFSNSILVVLLLNVLCVYIQMLFPACKPYFYSMFYAEKELKELPLRAFGLYSSYDATGLNICGLLLLLLYKFKFYLRFKYFFLFLFAYLSVFFVSRFAMIMGTGIFVVMLCLVAKYRTKYFLFGIFPPLFILCFYLIQTILTYFTVGDIRLNESYGASDEVLVKMIVFPTDFWHILMGMGDTIDTSDIGYIKLLYMMGVAGMLLLLLFYIYSLSWIRISQLINKDYRLLFFYTVSVLLLLIAFNFKLLLIYSRGFADLYIILVLYLYSKKKICYEKNKFSYF